VTGVQTCALPIYIENYSFLLDIKLIVLTLRILFTKESTEGIDVAQKNLKKAEALIEQLKENDSQ